jgi:hypothetical protein
MARVCRCVRLFEGSGHERLGCLVFVVGNKSRREDGGNHQDQPNEEEPDRDWRWIRILLSVWLATHLLQR